MAEGDRKRGAPRGEVASVSVRAAVDAVADLAIVLIDGYGIIASWNLGAERMMGWTAAEVVGKPYGSLYDADDQDGRKPDMDRTIAMHEGSRRQEWQRPRSDGSRFWAETTLTSIRDAAGMLLGFLDITRDVTDRRFLDSERERVQEQLLVSERLASLGLMAAGVAHEINNPLAFVVVNIRYALAELVELSRDPRLTDRLADIADALDNAREGAERIQQTAKDLGVFARNDEGRLGVVDVRHVLDTCVNMALTEIRHRARLIKDYQDTPAVEGSDARIGQVFLNLLLNAAHAIVEGDCENNEITVRTFVRDGEVIVEIRDTGTGIADEHLERIFDPFFTTKPVDVGTGLGLPVCRRIVTGLGGRIEVESHLGKGSTFRVRLPASHRPCSAAPPWLHRRCC
jgi:PAS domain S-box-containing protein